MKAVTYLFFAIAVLAVFIGAITPVSIGRCAVVALILGGLGLFIEYKCEGNGLK